VSVVAALVVVATTVVRRHHAPPRRTISMAWPDAPDELASSPAVLFGPPWPPTDEQWIALFDGAAWVHPSPGPKRRVPTPDALTFTREGRERPTFCKREGRCGVDLGGELWGEHVYAALDGVVERVQADERRGGLSVRLAHFGGGVFTQYFHLAATRRGLTRGASVKAGDVIGALGDTGLEEARAHLAFALSVRAASHLPEVYWDPTPWLERARVSLPPNGTVAGYLPPESR
jgi:murein DD-endopeptidase MepM/ murein hydrolase activator NlpD